MYGNSYPPPNNGENGRYAPSYNNVVEDLSNMKLSATSARIPLSSPGSKIGPTVPPKPKKGIEVCYAGCSYSFKCLIFNKFPKSILQLFEF